VLFSSYQFIFIFLPISWGVYFWLNARRLTTAAKSWLIGASFVFYGWWNFIYVPLILMSILVNYSIGTALASSQLASAEGKGRRKGILRAMAPRTLLMAGVAANLVVLGYYKYAGFFLSNLNALGLDVPVPDIALPLAISFFTFLQIAYLVDSYRGKAVEYDLLNYMLFVMFFPHLIAGPIIHHSEMMPQFRMVRNMAIRYRNVIIGLFIFSIGLFKKVVIADTLAAHVGVGFDQATSLNFIEAWVASLSFTFQLYFDFSGYSDMAIGASLLFNIRLPINFNSPYKALDIQEFWRRWHITLSRFLRDYLYIPLGGNRIRPSRTYLNIFVTFLLGGFWHGASWMFIIWGALHGIALIINRAWQRLGLRLPSVLAWLVTFTFVNVAWVFFRAKDMSAAMKVLGGMMAVDATWVARTVDELTVMPLRVLENVYIALTNTSGLAPTFLLLLGLIAANLTMRNTMEKYLLSRPAITVYSAVWHGLVFALSLYFLFIQQDVEFLYYDF